MHALKSGIVGAVLLMVGFRSAVAAPPDSVTLSAYHHETPVAPTSVQVNGQETPVWQTSSQDRVLTFRAPGAALTPSLGTLYLEVTYLDQGYGRLSVHYPGADGKTAKPDKYTRVVLSDSGKWVTSYERLSGLADTGIPDIQISLD